MRTHGLQLILIRIEFGLTSIRLTRRAYLNKRWKKQLTIGALL